MQEKIYEIIRNVLKVEEQEFKENIDKNDIWDSLQRAEIIFSLEDEFDIQFEEDVLAELITPEVLCIETMKRVEA